MTNLSDTSLQQTLTPSVTIIEAFKKASNRRAIKEAWKCARFIDKCLCVGLTAIFGVLMITSFSSSTAFSRYGFFVPAIPIAVASLILFRRRIVDTHPMTQVFGSFDRYFGFNYRFRRYLMFRADLVQGEIGMCDLSNARVNLQIEAKLLEGRVVSTGAGATMIIALITSLLTTISTQSDMISSGSIYLILFGLVICLYFYYFLKTVMPSRHYQQLELDCFLTWYEQELTSISRESSN